MEPVKKDELEEVVTLEQEGHRYFMCVTYGDIKVKERIPLHVFNLDEEKRKANLLQIAIKLKNKVTKAKIHAARGDIH